MAQNIRYMYSGSATEVQLRCYPGNSSGVIDIHDRVLDKYKHPPNRFEIKFQEYVPRYNTRLPRAPALRVVSAQEAQEISDRLSRPISRKSEERPISRKSEERPISRKSEERPISRKSEERPISRKSEESSISRKSEESSISKKSEEIPISRKSEERYISRKSKESSISRKSEESPISRKSEERYISRKSEESSTSRKSEESPISRKSEEKEDTSRKSPRAGLTGLARLKDSMTLMSQIEMLESNRRRKSSTTDVSRSDSQNSKPSNRPSDSCAGNLQRDSNLSKERRNVNNNKSDEPLSKENMLGNNLQNNYSFSKERIHRNNCQKDLHNRKSEVQNSESDKENPESKLQTIVSYSQSSESVPSCSSAAKTSNPHQQFKLETCQHLHDNVNIGVKRTPYCNAPETRETTGSNSSNTNTNSEVQQERNEKDVSLREYGSSENKTSDIGDMNFLKEIMQIKSGPSHKASSILTPLNYQVSQHHSIRDRLIVSLPGQKNVTKIYITNQNLKPQVNTVSKSENMAPLYPYIEQTKLFRQTAIKTKLSWQHPHKISKLEAIPGRLSASWRKRRTKGRNLVERSGLPNRSRNHKRLKRSNVRHKSCSTPTHREFPKGRDDLFDEHSSLSDVDNDEGECQCDQEKGHNQGIDQITGEAPLKQSLGLSDTRT